MNDSRRPAQEWLISFRLEDIGLGPFNRAGPAWPLRGACDGVPARLSRSARGILAHVQLEVAFDSRLVARGRVEDIP
jgi:hypothetical protein